MSGAMSCSQESTRSQGEHSPDPPKQSTPVQLAVPGFKVLPVTNGTEVLRFPHVSMSPRVRAGRPQHPASAPLRTRVFPLVFPQTCWGTATLALG